VSWIFSSPIGNTGDEILTIKLKTNDNILATLILCLINSDDIYGCFELNCTISFLGLGTNSGTVVNLGIKCIDENGYPNMLENKIIATSTIDTTIDNTLSIVVQFSSVSTYSMTAQQAIMTQIY
jgi:hypothetical protein